MPFLTLGQAAKECGKQKSTILDAIRTGRLSALKDDKNQWQIDPSELFRVYPAQHHAEHLTERYTTPAQLAKLLENEQRERERERSMLKEQIELLKAQVVREQEQADHWRNQATMLLTHQPELHPEPPKAEQPTRSRLYEKLFGRK